MTFVERHSPQNSMFIEEMTLLLEVDLRRRNLLLGALGAAVGTNPSGTSNAIKTGISKGASAAYNAPWLALKGVPANIYHKYSAGSALEKGLGQVYQAIIAAPAWRHYRTQRVKQNVPAPEAAAKTYVTTRLGHLYNKTVRPVEKLTKVAEIADTVPGIKTKIQLEKLKKKPLHKKAIDIARTASPAVKEMTDVARPVIRKSIIGV